MQNKTLLALVAVLVTLTAIWAATNYFPRLAAERSAYTEKVKSYDKGFVRSIIIKKSGETLHLKREEGVWMVNGKKADAVRVNGLIDGFFPSVAPELVAQTDKRHKEFELSEDAATKIVLDDRLVFLVGRNTGAATYIRFGDESKVYLLKWGAGGFSVKAEDWYDKTVLSFDQTKAVKMVFKGRDKKTVTLVKREDKWVEEVSGREAKSDKVGNVLAQASGLFARALYDAKAGSVYPGFPAQTFTVEYGDGSETLEIYKGSGSDYVVKRLSDGERFVVGEYAVSALLSGSKDIF